jgi:hypothetical protein
MRYLDLRKIFENKPRLHVLVWNRFDEDINNSAMLLVRDFLGDNELGDYVLPMLYPLGRYDSDFERMSSRGESEGTYPQDKPCFDHWGPCNDKGEQRTDRAELDLQVAGRHEEKAWNKIKEWIDNNDEDCFAWRSCKYPVWKPLKKEDSEDCQYACANNEKATKLLCDLKEQVPWFLKLIWYRATEVICDNLVEQSYVRLINPWDAQDRELLCSMLNQTFQEIHVGEFGLSPGNELDAKTDPSQFSVTHLAAAAFNAVTVVQQQHDYPLEYYANGNLCATRPYLFSDLRAYIKFWCPSWTF